MSCAALKCCQRYWKINWITFNEGFLSNKVTKCCWKLAVKLISDLKTMMEALLFLFYKLWLQHKAALCFSNSSKKQKNPQKSNFSRSVLSPAKSYFEMEQDVFSNFWHQIQQVARSTRRQHSPPGITYLLSPTIELTILTSHRKDMWSHDGQGCIKCALCLGGWLKFCLSGCERIRPEFTGNPNSSWGIYRR